MNRFWVDVRQGGSSVFNSYDGPAVVAVARAVARFRETYPHATGEVFVQCDDGQVGGEVWRGLCSLEVIR